MGYELRRGLSFCQIGNELIFLDLIRDRYFQLNPDLALAFRALLAAPSDRCEACDLLANAGVIERTSGAFVIEPVRIPTPGGRSPAMAAGRATAYEIAGALGSEWMVRRQLRKGRLYQVARRLSNLKKQIPADPVAALKSDQIIRAFELAKLVRSPANLCLSRSIAMVNRLSQQGCHAELVMGVRLTPFAAHSWVQREEMVLNDSPEEVARFTPIFVA